MPNPTQSQVYVDTIQTNIGVAYIQNDLNFVARKVFPSYPVDIQSGKYFIYTKADWLRDEVKLRADATESYGSGYNLTTATYSADVWALHKDVGDQTRANSVPPLDPDRDATAFLTQRMLLRQEKQWQADYFGTGIWGTDVTPTSLWSDYTASDPTGDVELGKQTILASTGLLPNTLVMDYRVYAKLKNHPDFVDRVKYTGGIRDQVATRRIMADLFELDNIYVTMAIENTAVEGETAAYAFTAGKHALLCYVPANPGPLAPAAGYTFVWRGYVGAEGMQINRMRIDVRKADRLEIEAAWDNKAVATDLGYFFSGAVA